MEFHSSYNNVNVKMAGPSDGNVIGTCSAGFLVTAFCSVTTQPFGSPETLALTLKRLALTKTRSCRFWSYTLRSEVLPDTNYLFAALP